MPPKKKLAALVLLLADETPKKRAKKALKPPIHVDSSPHGSQGFSPYAAKSTREWGPGGRREGLNPRRPALAVGLIFGEAPAVSKSLEARRPREWRCRLLPQDASPSQSIVVLQTSNIMEADRLFFGVEFLTEFIEKYRSFPCLWKIKSADYSNNVLRLKAWGELVEFSKKINNSADVAWLKKKVHTMRGTFRKELKKVTASSKSGAATEDIYEPKLWCYKLLRFTEDQEVPRQSTSNLEAEEDIDEEVTLTTPTSTSTPSPAVPPEKGTKPKKKRKLNDMDDYKQSLWEKASAALDTPEDEYTHQGKAIEAKLRRIGEKNYEQFLLTERLINDVIFAAMREQLTTKTAINEPVMNVPPPYHRQSDWQLHYSEPDNRTASVSTL